MENDDDKFEALLADKRHKELTGTMGKVLTELQKQKPDDGVRSAIEKQSKAIEGFADAIKKLPKPEKPEVNVEINNSELLPLLRDIKDSQKAIKEGYEAILEALDNKPMVSEFNFVYEYGSVKTAKVVYTPANKIVYKK
jgi:hypothetical protein